MFVLTILGKYQRNEKKIFSKKCNSIIKMANYQEARVKLTNTKSKKLKSAVKNKAGTILRLSKRKTLKVKNWHMGYF